MGSVGVPHQDQLEAWLAPIDEEMMPHRLESRKARGTSHARLRPSSQEWKQKLLHEVGDAVSATNAAANHLHHCLLQEEVAMRVSVPQCVPLLGVSYEISLYFCFLRRTSLMNRPRRRQLPDQPPGVNDNLLAVDG